MPCASECTNESEKEYDDYCTVFVVSGYCAQGIQFDSFYSFVVDYIAHSHGQTTLTHTHALTERWIAFSASNAQRTSERVKRL